MSEPTSSLFLAIEKLLEFTVKAILWNTQGKAAAIVLVHADGTVQTSAAVTPGTEERMLAALRTMAAKIEKGDGAKMQQPFKN